MSQQTGGVMLCVSCVLPLTLQPPPLPSATVDLSSLSLHIKVDSSGGQRNIFCFICYKNHKDLRTIL